MLPHMADGLRRRLILNAFEMTPLRSSGWEPVSSSPHHARATAGSGRAGYPTRGGCSPRSAIGTNERGGDPT